MRMLTKVFSGSQASQPRQVTENCRGQDCPISHLIRSETGERGLPRQRLKFPVTGYTISTVTVLVAVHPVATVYIIVAVPGSAPKTIPLVEPTVAMMVLLLVHVPPAVVSLNVTL